MMPELPNYDSPAQCLLCGLAQVWWTLSLRSKIDRWRCTMTRRKRYSKEFKREALRRANEEGVTDTLVAQELGFSTRQLRRWRDEEEKHGDDAFPGRGNAHDQEMMLLKRENAKLRQERDFLKEAAAYFAKESK